MPNTRVDVRSKIGQWFSGFHDHPICWLRGPAGSGKSAIAQTIAEEYEESGELAASFFFDPESTYRHHITDFLPTIAFQLSIKVPQMKVLMQRAFELDRSIPDRSHQYQFKKLIIDPLLELGEAVSRKIVVVDGFNQYDGGRWVEDFIILLTDACQDGRLPLRFCLTSRTDVPILMLPEAATKGIYSLVLEGFDAHCDIHIFFETKFQEIHRRNRVGGMKNVPDQWPSPSDVDRLAVKSSGLFTFASIIVKFVDGGRNDPYLNLQAVMTSLGDRRTMTSACHFKVLGLLR